MTDERDYEPKCVYCGGGPYDTPGFFVMEGNEVAYHEECPQIQAARQAFLEEQEFYKSLISAAINWKIVHGVLASMDDVPYDEIINSVRNKK